MIVAGKGGVGKTTVSAALARMAASAGLRTLIVDVEGTGALPALFGRGPLDYQPVTLQPATGSNAEITGRSVTPDDALVEYLGDHGLRRVSKRLTTTGTLDLVSTAIPGIRDILVLGKVKQLEQAAARQLPGAAEFIVVDAPAAGHAVTFLGSARGLLDAIGVGAIRAQADDVVSLLTDPRRCQVLLVTLPEETPINEAIETGFHLEDRAGVALAPIVVNGIYRHLDLPEDVQTAVDATGRRLDAGAVAALAEAAAFRRHRQELQEHQLARLADRIPLPQIHLPYIWSSDVGPAHLETLTEALAAGVAHLEPAVARGPGGAA